MVQIHALLYLYPSYSFLFDLQTRCHFVPYRIIRDYLKTSSSYYRMKNVACITINFQRRVTFFFLRKLISTAANDALEINLKYIIGNLKMMVFHLYWIFYNINLKSAEEGLGCFVVTKEMFLPSVFIYTQPCRFSSFTK